MDRRDLPSGAAVSLFAALLTALLRQDRPREPTLRRHRERGPRRHLVHGGRYIHRHLPGVARRHASRQQPVQPRRQPSSKFLQVRDLVGDGRQRALLRARGHGGAQLRRHRRVRAVQQPWHVQPGHGQVRVRSGLPRRHVRRQQRWCVFFLAGLVASAVGVGPRPLRSSSSACSCLRLSVEDHTSYIVEGPFFSGAVNRLRTFRERSPDFDFLAIEASSGRDQIATLSGIGDLTLHQGTFTVGEVRSAPPSRAHQEQKALPRTAATNRKSVTAPFPWLRTRRAAFQ